MSLRLQQSGLPLGRFQFRVVSRLGGGGFGVVDEIEITASNCSLAVGSRLARKRLNEQFNTHPEARERFEREILQVRAMADIRNVVNCRGENVAGGERFYVMDLFPTTLRTFMSASGGRSWREVARFAAAVADTMAKAHALGFVHRDLKPENILLTATNEHVVADWGLGYFLHKHSKVLVPLTRGGMGTEYYCSMEQWATGKCDERGDIYSLGMLTAELVAGTQVPIRFQGAGIEHDVATDVTASVFNRLLRKMTTLNAGGRPPSMAVARDSLLACLR